MLTKPQKTQQINEITINIHLSRQLAAVLIVAMLALATWALLAWGSNSVDASSLEAPGLQAPAAASSSAGIRKFYLTSVGYYGDLADGSDGNGADVCQSGYHFASIWELLDVSNLEYDGNPGYAITRSDSGEGPPTVLYGWVRTGYNDNTGTTPGHANCLGWDVREITPGVPAIGTVAQLPDDWTSASLQDLHVWDVQNHDCYTTARVWCIED
jgi:hypothetical protein